MKQYEVTFFWQGHNRKEIVSAENGTEAKKIIEARYSGARTMEATLK